MIDKSSFTLAIINNAIMHNKREVRAARIDLDIIKCLYRYNVITSVFFSGKLFNIKINLHSRLKLKNYYKQLSKTTLSPTQVSRLKLHAGGNLYIFKTHKGLLNQHEILRKKISGILLFEIFNG